MYERLRNEAAQQGISIYEKPLPKRIKGLYAVLDQPRHPDEIPKKPAFWPRSSDIIIRLRGI